MPEFANCTLRTTLLLIVALSGFTCFSSASAQTRVEPGEKVKVLYHRKWYDGEVIERDARGAILVEYTWISLRQGKFKREEVRKLCEYAGLDFCRKWQSESGTYKIEASLGRYEGENVTLIKPDLTEVTVPLLKLSKKDQIYFKKVKKNIESEVANGTRMAPTPKLPPVESFGSDFSSVSMMTDSQGSSGQANIQPLGAMPQYLQEFSTAGVGFNMTRDAQELVAAIPVGGPDQLVLMTAKEGFFGHVDGFQSQLYWVSLKQQKVLGTVYITADHLAIDYDPRFKLLLTFWRDEEARFGSSGTYTVWKLKPAEETATPIVRWKAQSMNWAQNVFGKIVSDRIVLAKTDKRTYQAWDFVAKKPAYTVKTDSFFDAPVVLSPDRQSLILPEDGRVTVVDAGTGKVKVSFPVKDRHVSGANVNAAGDKLAAITERNVYVWDLKSGSTEPEVHPAPLISSPFSSRVEWIGDDRVLGESTSGRVLYSLKLNIPLWSYKMDVSDSWLNRDPLKNVVVDNTFFYVARPGPFDALVAIGAVNLPGPQVDEITANIDPKSLLILREGVRVGLEMESVTDEAQVREWLLQHIADNGWVYDEYAEIKVSASMGVGSQQTQKYEEFGGGGGFSVSYRPYFSRLKVVSGSKVLWQSSTSTGPPYHVSGGQAEAQQYLAKYNKPNVKFFQTAKMDTDVIDPKYSRGFGVSLLGRRGIEVVSTSPPGREDDPEAAAEMADEERAKTVEERRNQEPEEKEEMEAE